MRQFIEKFDPSVLPMHPNRQKLMSKVCWAHLMKWNNHIEKILWNCIIGLSMCFILKNHPNAEVGICFSDQNHLISFRHSTWRKFCSDANSSTNDSQHSTTRNDIYRSLKCFVHPLFPSFCFWYFGHFSCVIFLK